MDIRNRLIALKTGLVNFFCSRDKQLHTGLGVLSIICALGGLYLYNRYGLIVTVPYVTTVVGILYEVQQKIRNEGFPTILDAIATAYPGYLFSLIYYYVR